MPKTLKLNILKVFYDFCFGCIVLEVLFICLALHLFPYPTTTVPQPRGSLVPQHLHLLATPTRHLAPPPPPHPLNPEHADDTLIQGVVIRITAIFIAEPLSPSQIGRVVARRRIVKQGIASRQLQDTDIPAGRVGASAGIKLNIFFGAQLGTKLQGRGGHLTLSPYRGASFLSSYLSPLLSLLALLALPPP